MPRVQDFCSRTVIMAHPDEALSRVAERMREQQVGTVVVVEQDARGLWMPRGIIQHRDIVTRVLSQPDDELDTIPAMCAMAGRLEVTRSDADLMEAVMQMREARLPCMPVVDRHGGLLGILRLEDLFPYLEVLTRALEYLVAKERTSGGTELPN